VLISPREWVALGKSTALARPPQSPMSKLKNRNPGGACCFFLHLPSTVTPDVRPTPSIMQRHLTTWLYSP
jgi:hypothetical protein